MKRAALLVFCSVLVYSLWADMPGNKPRKPVNVNVEFGDLSGYSIYYQKPYGGYGDDQLMTRDSVIVLSGGFGAPPCITLFGVNPNSQHTDSLTICNEEQGTEFLKLSVKDGRLVNERIEKNEIVVAPLPDIPPGGSSFYNQKINILVSVALASLLLLVAGFYRMQKKKEAI